MSGMPSTVNLMVYGERLEEFLSIPLKQPLKQTESRILHLPLGKVFRLSQIVEVHRCMEADTLDWKIAASI